LIPAPGHRDGDQFLREALDGELARIFNLALAALAEILQFRHRAQIAVPVLGSLARPRPMPPMRPRRPAGSYPQESCLRHDWFHSQA